MVPNWNECFFVIRSDLYPVLNDLPDYADSRLPTKLAIFNLDPRSISAQKSFFQLHDLSKIIDDVINNDDFSVFHVDSLNSSGIGLYSINYTSHYYKIALLSG